MQWKNNLNIWLTSFTIYHWKGFLNHWNHFLIILWYTWYLSHKVAKKKIGLFTKKSIQFILLLTESYWTPSENLRREQSADPFYHVFMSFRSLTALVLVHFHYTEKAMIFIKIFSFVCHRRKKATWEICVQKTWSETSLPSD